MSQDPKINFGVVFYFSKNGETIKQIAKLADEPPTQLTIEGCRPFECGIYTDIVPSDSGREGEYDDIQLPKLVYDAEDSSGKAVSQSVMVSANKDTPVFGALEQLEILEEDSPEEKKRKFFENRRRRNEALTCRVTLITPAMERRTHQDGKECGQCKYFNRKRGQEEIKKVTHEYQNGSMAMTEEIIKHVCDSQKKPNLTVDIAGHCPVNQELCADTSPACDSFEPLEQAQAGDAQVVGRA